MDYYIRALKMYATFEGRDTRKQFWMFTLFSFLISFGLSFIALSPLYALAVLIPSLAAGARRLHDTGKSGWWQLIALIPLLGFIILLVLFVLPSQMQANQYGTPSNGSPTPTPAPSTPSA